MVVIQVGLCVVENTFSATFSELLFGRTKRAALVPKQPRHPKSTPTHDSTSRASIIKIRHPQQTAIQHNAKNTSNMATMTVTDTQHKRRLPKNVKLPPENERYMRACADIASAHIQDYEAQADGSKPKKDLNLNSLRGQIAKKHYLKSQPPLTAIIAAVPEHYKKYILPKLIAKPIRMLPDLRNRRLRVRG